MGGRVCHSPRGSGTLLVATGPGFSPFEQPARVIATTTHVVRVLVIVILLVRVGIDIRSGSFKNLARGRVGAPLKRGK
jgi:hypothetical protein